MTRRSLNSSPRIEAMSFSATVSSPDAQSSPTSLIPPFHPSVNPQVSVDLRMVLQVPQVYRRTRRPLFLGCPAPSEGTERTVYDKSNRLEDAGMSHAGRFATLLHRHLQCPEITAQLCLLHDVGDPDPDGEFERESFRCISIGTTREHKHCSGSKRTGDQ